MELRHLRYFLALATELHFGRAAAAVHLSQPALSHSIAQLERELCVQLFSRDKRSVTLTAAGDAFRDDAARAVEAADRAVELAQRTSQGTAGHLRLGFLDASIHWPLPQVVAHFARYAPSVSLVLSQASGEELLARLAQREIDVALSRSDQAHPTLEFLVMRKERLVIALPAAHALAGKSRLTLDDLVDEPHILPQRDRAREFHDRAIELCAAAGFRPHVAAHATSLAVMLHLVAANVGVCFATEGMAEWFEGAVVFRPLAEVEDFTDLAVATRRDDDSAGVRLFLEMCESLARPVEAHVL